MTKSKHQHVVPHRQGWAVKATGARKATQVISTEKEAIERAREIAQNQQSEVIIYGSNGQIRDKDSHSNDSNPLFNQSREVTQHLEKVIQMESDEPAYDYTARPLWELIVEIGAQVPDEEWAKVPSDFARNDEYYMYRSPKES